VDVPDLPKHDSSFSFLDFTLDRAAERLLRGTSEIKLRPKSFQVLQYLVDRYGRLVTREELLQTVWGDVAVTDESVTKCIADIRKALADDSHKIIRTVSRRGFLFQPEVRLVGRFPVPDLGERLPRRETGSLKIGWAHRFAGGPAMLLAGTVVFVLVMGLVALQWHGDPSGRRPTFEAIAVLPFESLSSGTNQQYLADGMTDALITYLGQASPLRVIGRTSIGRYQGTKKSLQEIARELNVDVVVEGTIMHSGDRLRATAKLIQVSPEKHIWAGSYERSFRDALALQSEIANAIAGEIQGTLAPRQHPRATTTRAVNPEAQLAYWKARYFLHGRRERDAAKKSIEYSEQAVGLDPSYAPAHAAIALSYLMLSKLGGAFPSEVISRARTAAQRAVALDEELAEGHVALGAILLAYDWDWTGTEREIRRAISLNPSHADAHLGLANYLAAVGRVDEAVAEIRRARELDPFSFYINRNVGRILFFARRYDEAIAELRQTGDMAPNSFSVVDNWIIRSLLRKGLADDAVDLDLRMRRRDGLPAESLDALRAAHSENGVHGYWTRLRELLLPEFRSRVSGSFLLAEIDSFRDDKDEAFRSLEKAYQVRSGRMPWIKVDPSLDSLRSDPRFSALLHRMGLAP
jgi:TolB-like protein/DNA-binding winged helix-turn-helix (wHTH) protein/Flp pilus assembly protein TadD